MKIAADGYELGQGARGVGRVILNFLPRLAGLMPEDSFIVYTKEEAGRDRLPGVAEVVLPWQDGYLRWLNGPLRRALQTDKPDIFIASNYVLPLFYSGPAVLIEHDVSAVAHPEWYPRKYALTRKLLVSRSLKRASAVVVPSEFTRREILSHFDIPGSKILTIGWGVEDAFRAQPRDLVDRWKDVLGLAGKRLVGFLGSIFRRRHVPELVRAVGRLRRELPDLAVHIVGENLGGLDRSESDEIRALPWVRWDAALREEDLALFYSSLDAFAYLSEYEGFGFPPLEAMACGTPTVVLDRTSLAEVFRGLAVMVDSVEEDGVASGLRSALTDASSRDALVRNLHAARERFSWPRAAAELARLLSALKTGARSS
jgi:glycosyltransferase involved in cell wall biosynthesis